jgi:MYXO-CTERM domain-containing protein
LVADELIFDPVLLSQFVGQGTTTLNVSSISFSTTNLNAVAVSARPILRFYLSNGAGGGPGTIIGGFTINPITFNAQSVQVRTVNLPAGLLTLNPTQGSIWAGITYDNNNGATGATLAQMNNLGQGTFGPASVGSSVDDFFRTTAAGTFGSSNPAGGFLFFGGPPAANFGWSFTVAENIIPVPEPAPVAALGALALAALRTIRRRARSDA